MRTPRVWRLDGAALAFAVLALAALLCAVLAGQLLRARLDYPINYNEGWNAYFTGRVLQHLPMYPARDTRLINNYPPFSFHIVAALARTEAAILHTGRALAWTGFFGSALLVGLIARRLGGGTSGAILAALVFATTLATRSDSYMGMFDPNLPALMVMLAGLFTLLQGRGALAAIAAALLMAAAGFLKHSLVAIPATTAVWLLFTDRGRFWPWAAAGATALVAGLGGCAALYGPEFLHGLAVPRRTDYAEAVRKLLRWLVPIQLPLALATLPAAALGGPGASFVLLYLAMALGSGLVGASLAETNTNMLFDAVVAMSLGLGLLMARAAPLPRGWLALAAAAALCVSALQLATAGTASWSTWSTLQHARDATARAAIATIRAQPGPALCDDLLLCFLAGKPFEYDPLNYGQMPGQDQGSLQAEIAAARYGVIQVRPVASYWLPATRELIAGRYAPVPGLDGLYTPRAAP